MDNIIGKRRILKPSLAVSPRIGFGSRRSSMASEQKFDTSMAVIGESKTKPFLPLPSYVNSDLMHMSIEQNRYEKLQPYNLVKMKIAKRKNGFERKNFSPESIRAKINNRV